MRMLILGASGFIGRHLVRRAERAGIAWLGTQSRSPKEGLIPFTLGVDRLRDRIPEAFLAPSGLIVVHATISGGPDQCARDPETSRRINVAAVQELVHDLGPTARHILLSSSYVFRGDRGGYREDAPCDPICEYGRQKVELERFFLGQSPGSLVLRLDKVVGDDPTEKHLFTDWSEQFARAGVVRCLRGQTMSPVGVDDVADGIVTAARERLAGIWHLSGESAWTRTDLARCFQVAVGCGGEVREVAPEELPFLDPRPLQCHLDGTAWRARFGRGPQSLETVLQRFAAALRHQSQ